MKFKKSSKFGRLRACFAGFLVFITILSGVMNIFSGSDRVYAEPLDETNTELEAGEEQRDEESEENNETRVNTQDESNKKDEKSNGDGCKKSLGSLGWLVCPATGKIAEATDWLYDKIEGVLQVDPIPAEDGSPIYEIWKYSRAVTNIVFIIFLLVVIYSQLTGYGISNYGIKKVLPKVIVVAILINLSFLICTLAIDVSNIIGNGIRGVFTSVEEAVLNSTEIPVNAGASMSEVYSAMAGGTALAVGGAMIAFELAEIWMLIPMVLGAIVSVVSGLITIALRQAVVALLVMISPLAIVAYMLPNTESWFKKWKKLLTQMLVFYPMFSLLFGASNLAGFAILAAAKDAFGVILGIAVQMFPLFFSWKLMKMSDTFLGNINSKIQGLAARPLAANRAWADSHRNLSRQKRLDTNRAFLPTTRLNQFLSNRKIAREEEASEIAASVKLRGQAYAANRNYRRNGVPSKEGEEAYERQARNMSYTDAITRHQDNMRTGLGQLEVVKAKASEAQKARLGRLDIMNVKASDHLKMELERGARIDYNNIVGYYDRVKKANYANADLEALNTGNTKHQMHDGVLDDEANIARYRTMKEVMEGKDSDVKYILAGAAHTYDAQSQIMRGKFKNHFDNTEATQDIVNELNTLTKNRQTSANIDAIIAGVRTLNMRGDTDLAWEQLNNVLQYGDAKIGSHALQAISSYCMFDVKGNDPAMRRFGKYINLETAKMFNEADPSERRTRRDISLYEYINGEYINRDEQGNVIYDANGQPEIKKTKKNIEVLLKGTSFKDMERTGIATMEEMIRAASVDLNLDEDGNEIGTFNYEKFKKNEEAVWNAILPNVIGDHFSYLSGSEQIMAMSKGLTGVDVGKHKIDWEGIFGKDVARQLTTEQKKDYIKFLNKRTKTFLGGQVPLQIARTKTDILEAVRNQYALKEAIEHDPTLLDRMSDPAFKMSNEDYKRLEDEYLDDIKREFVDSFKEDALKGFVKMHHKGYQGEAKDGLIQLLDPDALYREYFGRSENNRSRRDNRDEDDDDDGMPVNFGDGTGGLGGPVYNDRRVSIERIFDSYRGLRKLNVNEFWDEVKPIILGSDGGGVFVDSIENRLSQYTDVSALYTEIINQMFGGFGE
ncbi:hypothetical protein IKD82_02890 [Candidatus Saccharibacteria bacterium]|nr:hypothetical protein [Candidatus Saccharibacteria bacterium]